MRVTLERVGVVAPPPGSVEVALDVRGEWPGAPERLARTDRLCHLALLAAYRALGEPAGAPRPVAVVYGSALAALATNLRYYDKIQRRGVRGADPKRFPYTAPNAPAGEVAIAFRLVGPSVSLTSGFASGVQAVAAAARLVARGRAPSALVVVADAWSDDVGAILARAGVELAGPREGAVALLLEADGKGRPIDAYEEGFAAPVPAPAAVAPAPLFAVVEHSAGTPSRSADENSRLVEARCPLTGAWATVRLTTVG